MADDLYRAYAYFPNAGAVPYDKVTGPAVPNYSDAVAFLDRLTARGATGGDIERKVPGVGWVLARGTGGPADDEADADD